MFSTCSIYIGVILKQGQFITNQKRYDAVLNEMLQLLQTRKDSIAIELVGDRFIILRSKAPNSESDQVTFPLSC